MYILSSLVAGAASSGHLINSVDLSPRYASGLCGIANGTGQIIAILAPLLVQYMVPDKVGLEESRNSFLSCNTYVENALPSFSKLYNLLFFRPAKPNGGTPFIWLQQLVGQPPPFTYFSVLAISNGGMMCAKQRRMMKTKMVLVKRR